MPPRISVAGGEDVRESSSGFDMEGKTVISIDMPFSNINLTTASSSLIKGYYAYATNLVIAIDLENKKKLRVTKQPES